jgi:uncharacterized phage protein (TIGR02218 family)
MTFEFFERSADKGRPVELYTFTRDYQVWRFTSADRDIILSGATFKSTAIQRSAIESSAEMARNNLTVTVPRDNPVADLYRIFSPTLTLNLVLEQYHHNDPDGEVNVIWSGRITTVDFLGIEASITCEPIVTSVKRVGLRRAFLRQCPHVLYDNGCKVNRETHRVDGSANSITGLVVQVSEASGFDDGHFAGGYIEYEVALGIPERRWITDHTGDQLTLSVRPNGMVVNQSVKLYPGCIHTPEVCSEKFDNILNYGGFPYFALKNPMGGDPIF